MKTLDDVSVEGKVVFVRADLNCSVKDGKLESSDRIEAHAKTIAELSQKGAKVVVLAHQGRVGDDDFISLEPHAQLLSTYVGKHVLFVDDVCGKAARDAIKNLRNGEIILLENTRLLAEETVEQDASLHAKTLFIRKLAPLGNLFVLDGFSVAHRPHASVVGFAPLLGVVAGRVMEEEVKSLRKGMDNPRHPLIVIVGGAKVKDALKIIQAFLPKADMILTGGMVANLFLVARGVSIGPSQKDLDPTLIEKARTLASERKILTPSTVAASVDGTRVEYRLDQLPANGPILDIGETAAREYAQLLRSAETMVMNGPVGVYEELHFRLGTRIILDAMRGHGFSLLGGGNTIDAIQKCGFLVSDFGYVSLAGKAFVEYLLGEKLPGVQILEQYPPSA